MRRVLSRWTLAFALLTALLGALAVTPAQAQALDAPTYRVLNNSTGGSLLPQDYGNNPAEGIYMYAWNPAYTYGGDRWTFERTDAGYYLIRNDKTGRCLKPGGPYYGKTAATQGPCQLTMEYQWTAQVRGDGQYKLINRSSRQVLTPYYGNGLNEVVVLEPDSNIAKNWWSIDRA